MQNKLHKLQSELNSAYQHLKQGTDAAIVAKRLGQLLRKWPNQPDIIHLLALAFKQNGDFVKAEQQFRLALSIDAKNTQVHNNLANLYKENLRFKDAVAHYKAALKLQPGFTEAKKNLGLCLYEMQDYSESIQLFSAVLMQGEDISARNALANSLRENGQYEEAEEQYLRVLQFDPSYVKAWHNRGINHHRNKQPESAMLCYKEAIKIDPQLDVSSVSLSLLYKEVGDLDSASTVLREAKIHNPNSTKIVSLLNEALWESGQIESFRKNTISSLEKNERNTEMQVSLIGQLIKAGSFEEALYYSERALEKLGAEPALILYRGQLLAEQSEYIRAFDFFEIELRKNFDRNMAIEQIKLAIIIERYERAQYYLDALIVRNSLCQLTWALQSLVWKFTAPTKYEWLNGNNDFINSYQLQTPKGYQKLEDFLDELNEHLLGLHQTTTEPLDQTLRNGTQTAAKIFERNEPVIRLLKHGLQEIIGDYISGMSVDESHPFLGRKSEGFEISGSWSVKLRANGFHVNHVHPAGWISSSSYIHLPFSDNANKQAGAIKFGESPLSLEDREKVEKTIQPKLGMVVLFPSYTWHGTVPFTGPEGQYRLTAPFDVLPK